MSKIIRHLMTIDPQRDFCDKDGSLFVPGADEDMNRLARFISKVGPSLEEIHCTLDSHQTIHIAHPIFWVDGRGNPPKPFTQITHQEVKDGVWKPKNLQWMSHALHYTKTLADHGRYDLTIWPVHCRIGSFGHSIVPKVFDTLMAWEEGTFSKVDFVAKGSNMLTEHYSAVQADVPIDDDATTKLNTTLIDSLITADEIFATAEALSHCVANTFTDIADNFGEDNVKKIILLIDTTSNVPSFEKKGEDFIKKMTKRGMRVAKTTDF